MEVCRYCTPEWLEESAKHYHSTPRFQQQLAKVTTKVFYRIKAEPSWGIDKDIIFGGVVDQGQMVNLAFYSEQDAKREADFIMAATPQEWKKLLRKESKFLGDFMVGKITLEQGSRVGVLGLAPHAGTFIDALTPGELKFPDEMSAEELEEYRAYIAEFRAQLDV
jgi:hypothetical protein